MDGTLRAFDPDYGLFQGAKEVLPDIVKAMANPERLLKLTEASALTQAVVARRVPARIEYISDQLARGELTVRARSLAHPADRVWLRRLLDNALVSALFAVVAIALTSAVFMLVPGGPQLTPMLTAWDLVAALLGFIGLVPLRLVIGLFVRE